MDRRRFLRLGSATVMWGVAHAAGAQANPLAQDAASLYRRVIPGRKDLPVGWVRALALRDAPEDAPIRCADKSHLPHIGMTVGGIAAGTLYLTGDGRLAVWDLFNQPHEGVVPNRTEVPAGMDNLGGAGPVVRERDGANYVRPPTPESHPQAFRHGFELEIDGITRPLDASGWEAVSFRGDWPVGRVEYSDPACPLVVSLDAWSPFVPLELDDSTLPVTVMEFAVENTGGESVGCSLRGVLENPVLHHSARERGVPPVSSGILRDPSAVLLVHGPAAAGEAAIPPGTPRPDLVFDDFERAIHAPWVAEGEAFGAGPVEAAAVPGYQGDLGMHGRRALQSHAAAPGDSIPEKDAATGTLTSPEFTIERDYITCLLGGGRHPGKTGIELLVEGEVLASLSGRDENRMRPAAFDTRAHAGKRARLRVIDHATGGWGNTGVDRIVFTDRAPAPETPLEQLGDYGGIVLALLDSAAGASPPEALQLAFRLAPGETRRLSFVLAWHFPNLAPLPGLGRRRPRYATRFADATAVAREVIARLDVLRERTFRWVDTWYDSSLPRWLMDRALLTANTLQTSNCLLLEDGRFWAWEGVGCCPGTCNHVWHYAQSIARLFPALERGLRENVDLGLALTPEGGVRYRGEAGGTIAVDGQAAVVLRTWREHLCSADDSFLRRVWPAAKRALGWLIRFDENDRDGPDGLLDGRQHNTLDADWYGKVHCLNSLYLAALRAGEAMAAEMDDAAFASLCRQRLDAGAKNIGTLFNGEYYIQLEDPAHQDAIGVGTGCHIDQVIGQWWATQTGLGRIYDAAQIRSALHSLWKYNFVPHINAFRQTFKRGRFDALGDEAGLIMCSWPKGGLREDFMRHWQYGYFNECMTGFEYQAAAHMIQEGAPLGEAAEAFSAAIEDPADPRSLTLRGLAVARAIHDRYAPSRRNPYNEIECSDHYARAAASYSVFLAACGFHHHGPRGELAFAPKLSAAACRLPFITATCWGRFEQTLGEASCRARLTPRHGTLPLRTLRLRPGFAPVTVTARVGPREIPLAWQTMEDETRLDFQAALVLAEGEALEIEMS